MGHFFILFATLRFTFHQMGTTLDVALVYLSSVKLFALSGRIKIFLIML